jgi:hypothetical protein
MSTTKSNPLGYPPAGSLVLSGYWRLVSRVVSINNDGSVTVEGLPDHPESASQWRDDRRVAGIRTHRTPFDPKRDRVIA